MAGRMGAAACVLHGITSRAACHAQAAVVQGLGSGRFCTASRTSEPACRCLWLAYLSAGCCVLWICKMAWGGASTDVVLCGTASMPCAHEVSVSGSCV